jgi:trehalose 6-phosphate synthase
MRDDFPRSVAGYLRYDALLVNPIKDGLNLVAKEGPLVNRRDGVVCLSTEAGAYDELESAVLAVHPYDLDQTAGALHTALTMPDGARREMASRLRDLAAAVTPATWLQELISVACR